MPDTAIHLDHAHRHFSDPRVARWHWPGDLGGPRTREQAAEMLVRYGTALASGRLGSWWWREISSGELIAQVGLNTTEVEDEEVVEVGWSVDPARWGEGFAVEAARASVRWASPRPDWSGSSPSR